MIDKQTLKKHNLKAVPFSCIREGETFNIDCDFGDEWGWWFYTRRLVVGYIRFADEDEDLDSVDEFLEDTPDRTVYVPIWRVCGEVVK